eukprot:GHVU01232469.1.p1 GENE.GHVU01232469.1~~GHVU01232469.1.p1  ORF type:complete len:231 (+),score=33.49 GHVU01232469.1:77-769(+)
MNQNDKSGIPESHNNDGPGPNPDSSSSRPALEPLSSFTAFAVPREPSPRNLISPRGALKLPESGVSGELRTLADIKRRVRQDFEEEEPGFRRFKTLNYSSDDSHLQDAKRLRTYYCAVCGTHALVSDADIADAPKRLTDGAYVIDEEKVFLRPYMDPGPRVLLKRPRGVEIQHRKQCRDCALPLAYKSDPPKDKPSAALMYVFPEALTQAQTASLAMRERKPETSTTVQG